jgi:hypothetical protein
MARTNQPTKATQATKDVAAVLKRTFPDTRFSVRHHLYTRGCKLAICWWDGPSEDDVKRKVEALSAVHDQFTCVYYFQQLCDA